MYKNKQTKVRKQIAFNKKLKQQTSFKSRFGKDYRKYF